MTRLLASLALFALGFSVHAAPHTRGSSHSTSSHSGSATSHASSTSTSTTFGASTSIKHSSNTMKQFTTTNTNIALKFVSKPSFPTMVKAPGRGSTAFVSTRLYAADHGTRFKRGVFYRGLNHRHWTARHFHPRWRTWFWYDPSTAGWYYWNAGRSCFLPTNVIASYPPVIGQQEGTIPPDGEEVPKISGGEVPDVPNPEGIE